MKYVLGVDIDCTILRLFVFILFFVIRLRSHSISTKTKRICVRNSFVDMTYKLKSNNLYHDYIRCMRLEIEGEISPIETNKMYEQSTKAKPSQSNEFKK